MDRYPRARLHGMRWILVEATDRVLPEIDEELADYALRELRGRGIDIRLGTTHRAGRGRPRPPLDRREAADAHGRLDRRRRAASRACATCRCHWTSAGGCRSTTTSGSRGSTASGRSATARRCRIPSGGFCPPTAQHAIRQAQVAAAQRRGRAWHRSRASSTTAAARRSSTSAATRRSAGSAAGRFRGFPAWWMARTYHISQIPAPSASCGRSLTGRSACPSAATSPRSGSIGHPRPLRVGGLRAGRQPPAGRLAPAEDNLASVAGHPLLLRPGDRHHRPRQGQLLLHLVPGRVLPAAGRAGRGDPAPQRGRGARARLSQLRQDPEALRAGLPALRRRPLPPASGTRRRALGPSAARCERWRSRSRGRSARRPASWSGRAAA